MDLQDKGAIVVGRGKVTVSDLTTLTRLGR
jgi:hypothetical protein